MYFYHLYFYYVSNSEEKKAMLKNNKKKRKQTSLKKQKKQTSPKKQKKQKIKEQYEDFIDALKEQCYSRMLLKIHNIYDDLPCLDEKYNLIEFIVSSNRHNEDKQKFINEIIDNCNSKVNTLTLLICARHFSKKIVRLLLSRGSDPNASFINSSYRDNVIANIIYNPLFRIPDNLYWLIVYGLDVSVAINYNKNGDLINDKNKDKSNNSDKDNSDKDNSDKDNSDKDNSDKSSSDKSSKYNNTLSGLMSLRLGDHESITNYRITNRMINATNRAIKDMRNKFMDSCTCLFPDLFDIIFDYLLWI